MNELKPCPFCGAEIIKHRYSGFNDFIDELHIQCDSCGADFHIKVGYPTIASNPQVKGKIDAIARWNRRAANG